MRFTGAVSDAEKKLIFAACDIHAMPSVQLGEMIEGFGIVFLEAAAAGKPSICGNIGGQAEAVLDGRTGLVVTATTWSASPARCDRWCGTARCASASDARGWPGPASTTGAPWWRRPCGRSARNEESPAADAGRGASRSTNY